MILLADGSKYDPVAEAITWRRIAWAILTVTDGKWRAFAIPQHALDRARVLLSLGSARG